MIKKMKYVKNVDNVFTHVPTHLYSLEYCKKFILGKKVLDLGCWNGAFEKLLIKFPITLTGVDLDIQALKTARKEFPKFKFISGDIETGIRLREKQDVVLFWMTLEHLKNESEALKNINMILKKNGRLFLSTPSNHPLSILFDFPYFLIGHKHFDPNYLKELLSKAGFIVEDLRVVGGLWVALRITLLIFYKYLLNQALPPMSFVEERQLSEYRSGRGFYEVFLRARKIK
jgi:SAM-dependent methyltransferase